MVGHLSYKQFTQVRSSLRSGSRLPARSVLSGAHWAPAPALSGRPLDVQRPVPATVLQNGSTGKAAPSYGVTGRFESGFCKGVSHTDTVQKKKTGLQSQCRQMKRRQKKRSKEEME